MTDFSEPIVTRPEKGSNLVAAILDQIERVVAKRERWRGYAKDQEDAGSFASAITPAIALMTAAIDAGKTALAEDDVIKSLRAYEDLKGFDDDD